jgi:hypothetical protein
LDSDPAENAPQGVQTEALSAALCRLHVPPVSRFTGDRLNGYQIDYPNNLALSVQSWEGLRFTQSFDAGRSVSFEVAHARSYLPLDAVDQVSVPYEYLSIPALSASEEISARRELTLGGNTVVAVDTRIPGQTDPAAMHTYFVAGPADETGQADVLVFRWLEYRRITQGDAADGLSAVPGGADAIAAEIEALISSVSFDAPETWAVTLTNDLPLPVAPVDMPIGVLIKGHTQSEDFTLLAPGGDRLGGFSAPSLGPVRVISRWTGEINPLRWLTYSTGFGSSAQILIFQGRRIIQEIETTQIGALAAAPGQAVLAYTGIQSQGFQIQTHLFFDKIDRFPTQTRQTAEIDGGLPVPIGVYAHGGQPLGLWITRQPYGIGDLDVVSNAGLTYTNAALTQSRTVLPGTTPLLGLSPDFSRVAYPTNTASGDPAVTVLNLATRKAAQFDPLPWPERQAFLATQKTIANQSPSGGQFSPNNRYFAWVDTFTYATAEGAGWRPHTRLRLADLSNAPLGGSGLTTRRLPDSDFAKAAGFSPDRLTPLGWLDNQTLLLQVQDSASGQHALLLYHANANSISFYSQGEFMDFVR